MVSIAPIEPIDQPELPKPSPPPRRRSLGLEALAGLIAAVVVAALGAPIGLIWSRIAPKVELVQTAYGPYPIEGEPEGYFADDGWFMIIGVAAGVLLAVLAWMVLRRHRGAFVLAGLVIGSAGASVLAAWLGNKIGYAHYLDLAEHAPVDTHIFRPVKVRAGDSGLLFGFIPWVQGSLLIQAVAAAVVYTCLAGFHGSPTLTYDPDPAIPGQDHAYHPAYAGYPYGDQAQQYPAYGQPTDGRPGYGQPGYGPAPAAYRPAAEGEPGYGRFANGPVGYGEPGYGQPGWGQPANGQAYGHPVPGRVDLSKPGHPQAAPGRPVPGEAAGQPQFGQPGPVSGGQPGSGPVLDGQSSAFHPGAADQPPVHPEPGPAPGADHSTREDWRAP